MFTFSYFQEVVDSYFFYFCSFCLYFIIPPFSTSPLPQFYLLLLSVTSLPPTFSSTLPSLFLSKLFSARQPSYQRLQEMKFLKILMSLHHYSLQLHYCLKVGQLLIWRFLMDQPTSSLYRRRPSFNVVVTEHFQATSLSLSRQQLHQSSF